jgi:hypothetical protein
MDPGSEAGMTEVEKSMEFDPIDLNAAGWFG